MNPNRRFQRGRPQTAGGGRTVPEIRVTICVRDRISWNGSQFNFVVRGQRRQNRPVELRSTGSKVEQVVAINQVVTVVVVWDWQSGVDVHVGPKPAMFSDRGSGGVGGDSRKAVPYPDLSARRVRLR